MNTLHTPNGEIPHRPGISYPKRSPLIPEEEGELALARVVEKMRDRLYFGNSITSIPPTEWELPGWLARNSLIALAAPPKAGKSFVALLLGVEASFGGSFAGEKFSKPLKVMYLAFEKYNDTRDRIEALEQKIEKKLSRELFSVYAPERAPQLSNAAEVSKLERLFEEEKPQLVIVDTLARCIGDFDENSAADTSRLVAVFDRLRVAAGGCCLLFLHHEGKDGSKGMRGSSNIAAAVNTVWKVSGTPATVIELAVTASNAAEPPSSCYYRVVGELLPPAEGEIEKRSVGVLVATYKPDIGSALRGQIGEVLRNTFPEGATRKQIGDALNVGKVKGGKDYLADSTVGTALTSLKRDGSIEMGGGRSPRWSLTEIESTSSKLEECF